MVGGVPYEVEMASDGARRLKQLVADLALDKAMLQDVLRKEDCRPPVAALWRPTRR